MLSAATALKEPAGIMEKRKRVPKRLRSGHFRFELFLAVSAPSGNGITHGDDLSL